MNEPIYTNTYLYSLMNNTYSNQLIFSQCSHYFDEKMSFEIDEKLESIEAANYLIQELLAQIDALKQENNQV